MIIFTLCEYQYIEKLEIKVTAPAVTYVVTTLYATGGCYFI